MKFAVLQMGYGIFGVGSSPEIAKSNVLRLTDYKTEEALDADLRSFREASNGDLVLVGCSDELYREYSNKGSGVFFDFVDEVAYLPCE